MTQRYIGGLIYNPPGGYSGYFDGTGDYLTVPDNTAFDLGSGDFTFETWIFPTAAGTTGQFLISQWGSANYGYAISLVSSGSALTGIKFEYSQTGAVGNITARTYSQTIPLNAWSHIALVRASGTTTAYFNGAAVSTSSDNVTIYNSTATVHIAANPDGGINQTVFGYLSNLRLVKGTAVYTTAFTPPNGPLQNITNTSLLTCRYPTFVDGSSNAFTITVNGNTTVSTQNPFPLTTLPNPAQGGAGNGIFSMSQYQSLKQQNLWPTVDPYFENTTLLLHGNGTNGGQNNSFLDSGTANGGVGFSITRNGNTTQGTFSPFSVGAGYWSNYFDGSSGYITAPGDTAFAFGTGDFTVEMWVNISGTNAGLISHGPVATLGSWMLEIISGTFYWQAAITGNLITASASSVLGTGWKHVAVTRASGTTRLFADGLLLGSSSTASNFNTTTGPLSIGKSYNGTYTNGYMSNVRIIKGTALYTAAFTPPTAPLTAISGTSLLTCQSNRFVDNGTANSGSGFTITAYGSSSVQAFSLFAPTAAYSASTVGGSGYFDGSGDYLSVGSNAAFTLGTGDFTIECWYYPSVSYASGNGYLFDLGSNGTRIQLYLNTVYFLPVAGSSIQSAAGVGMSLGWHHVAAVRSGSTMTLYVDGVSAGTTTNSSNLTDTLCRIGSAGYTGDYFNGYISSFRIVKGTAVYTSAFTPPTAPLTNISNTSLLLNFTNAAIIDNTAKNVLETVADAQISTTQSKFGGASLYFDGTGDWLAGPPTPQTDLGSGDFTIEAWLYRTASGAASDSGIVSRGAPSTLNGFVFGYTSGNVLVFNFNYSGAIVTGVTVIPASTWTHVAVSRNGNTFRLFVNGVLDATATSTNSQTTNASDIFYVGRSGYDSGRIVTGYLDDVRITKGIARYTSNFTPQTSQWQDQ